MNAEKDFSICPPTKHAVSHHANLRRRQRTNLSFREFANAELDRKIVRGGTVVTVLPIPKKQRHDGGRSQFMTLYRESRTIIRAVRKTKGSRDETKYHVDLTRLTAETKHHLTRGPKQLFTALLHRDGSLDHESVKAWDDGPEKHDPSSSAKKKCATTHDTRTKVVFSFMKR
jgi:hypothetical protein